MLELVDIHNSRALIDPKHISAVLLDQTSIYSSQLKNPKVILVIVQGLQFEFPATDEEKIVSAFRNK